MPTISTSEIGSAYHDSRVDDEARQYDPWGSNAVESALCAHDYLVDGRYESELSCMSF